MTHEEMQDLEIGQRVLVNCPEGLGSRELRSYGTVTDLTRGRHPVYKAERVMRVSVTCDSDKKEHSLLPSLVQRLSLLELIAEAAQ